MVGAIAFLLRMSFPAGDGGAIAREGNPTMRRAMDPLSAPSGAPGMTVGKPLPAEAGSIARLDALSPGPFRS